MECHVRGLSKSLGGKPVLKQVSFSAAKGELASLIGPSGVGKTTLLNILAGLDLPDSGEVVFTPEPSKARPVILVFQDYLLFPAMTVYENTAFGLRARRMERKELDKRVRDILGYFHLGDKMRHYPAQLSAGQKQRVAIARAMVVNPGILLLDEPFANLDPNLKLTTAEFIRATQQEFGITTICVTHDLAEAFIMSDRVGIMLDGELVQYAPAGEVYARPATLEAASFLGPVNTIPARLVALLEFPQAPAPALNGALHARPEAVRIRADADGPGLILERRFAGQYVCYTVGVEQEKLLVYSLDDDLLPGDRVRVAIAKFFTAKDGS